MSTFSTHYRLLFAFVLAILLASSCSDQGTAPPGSRSAEVTAVEQKESGPAEIPATPQPADSPEEQQDTSSAVDVSSSSQAVAEDGQKIYQASCQACHANGVAGAPKFGNKEAWAPRIAKGNDALFLSVKNGLKAMPPKGACMNCSDDDLRAAMEYMVEQGS